MNMLWTMFVKIKYSFLETGESGQPRRHCVQH